MNDSRFKFGDIVVVDASYAGYMRDIGVIVKTWGASANRPIHYEVYVRISNAIIEFDEDKIRHYVFSKDLTDEQADFCE